MKFTLIATKQKANDTFSFIFAPEQPLQWKAGQLLRYAFQDRTRWSNQWMKMDTADKCVVDCQIAATHRRSAMPKQTRKHDFGGGPSIGKPKRDTSRPEDASGKQRKQHAHKAPVRRAASKFRE